VNKSCVFIASENVIITAVTSVMRTFVNTLVELSRSVTDSSSGQSVCLSACN